MVKVKICGITNWTDARLAVQAGADALGFNFYPKSPRYIEPHEARRISGRLPRRIQTVGVFVNAPVAAVLRIAREVDLNFLQLHGEEPASLVRELAWHYPVIKAFRVRPGFRPVRLARYFEAFAFLLDGFDSRRRGGTGRSFDWRLARRAKRFGPIVLSGGLTPQNIGRAIATAQPFGVDVCSGVELRPGKKDPALLEALMRAVDAAIRRSV